MSKFYLHTPTPSSKKPLQALKERLETDEMLSKTADYHIIPGDRIQALQRAVTVKHENNGEIIHLWAGENSSGTQDEKYRAAITCLSDYQLCTNEAAKENAENILRAAGREPNAYVVGNLMLDDLETDDEWFNRRSLITRPFDLILINPETGGDQTDPLSLCQMAASCNEAVPAIWIEPNDDPGSKVIRDFSNLQRIGRNRFLALVKYCNKFITNSSCAFYEAQFLKDDEDIIIVGERNKERVSRDSDMSITGAVDRTIEVLKEIANE